MQQIFLDFSRYLVQLNRQIIAFAAQAYNKNLQKILEASVSGISSLLFNLYDMIEHWKSGKVAEVVLHFLDEMDHILDIVNSKVPVKQVESYIHLTRELIQVVRTYVVFLDQQRQEYFA